MERACCKGAADSFTLPDAAEHYSPDLRIEPVHLDLQVAIDIEQRRLDVRLGVAVRARQAGASSSAR